MEVVPATTDPARDVSIRQPDGAVQSKRRGRDGDTRPRRPRLRAGAPLAARPPADAGRAAAADRRTALLRGDRSDCDTLLDHDRVEATLTGRDEAGWPRVTPRPCSGGHSVGEDVEPLDALEVVVGCDDRLVEGETVRRDDGVRAV